MRETEKLCIGLTGRWPLLQHQRDGVCMHVCALLWELGGVCVCVCDRLTLLCKFWGPGVAWCSLCDSLDVCVIRWGPVNIVWLIRGSSPPHPSHLHRWEERGLPCLCRFVSLASASTLFHFTAFKSVARAFVRARVCVRACACGCMYVCMPVCVPVRFLSDCALLVNSASVCVVICLFVSVPYW